MLRGNKLYYQHYPFLFQHPEIVTFNSMKAVYKSSYINVCNTGRVLLKYLQNLTDLKTTYYKPRKIRMPYSNKVPSCIWFSKHSLTFFFFHNRQKLWKTRNAFFWVHLFGSTLPGGPRSPVVNALVTFLKHRNYLSSSVLHIKI